MNEMKYSEQINITEKNGKKKRRTGVHDYCNTKAYSQALASLIQCVLQHQSYL